MPVKIDLPVFATLRSKDDERSFYSDALRDRSDIILQDKSLKDWIVSEILTLPNVVLTDDAKRDISKGLPSEYDKQALDSVIKRTLLSYLQGEEQEVAFEQFKRHVHQEGPGYLAINSLKQIVQGYFFNNAYLGFPNIVLDRKITWSVNKDDAIVSYSAASMQDVALQQEDGTEKMLPLGCAYDVSTMMLFDKEKKRI